MKIRLLMFLGIITIVILSIVGCEKDKDRIIESECNVTGVLQYNNTRGGWEIRETVSNTIDSVNIYIINEYEITYSKDTVLNVHASGMCSQYSDQIEIPAGTMLYNLDVKSLDVI